MKFQPDAMVGLRVMHDSVKLNNIHNYTTNNSSFLQPFLGSYHDYLIVHAGASLP